jgi:pyruvate dehydrogenase (quinone)
VDDPERIADAWDEALSADKPVLIEAVTDPEVPPLPPHIRFEQARKLAAALPGDPARGEIVTQSLKGKLKEFINR